MKSLEKIVKVDVPLGVTFATWANYNSFPAFTKNRVTVEKLGRPKTRWIAEIDPEKNRGHKTAALA